jgi:hypothetical protein
MDGKRLQSSTHWSLIVFGGLALLLLIGVMVLAAELLGPQIAAFVGNLL